MVHLELTPCRQVKYSGIVICDARPDFSESSTLFLLGALSDWQLVALERYVRAFVLYHILNEIMAWVKFYDELIVNAHCV